MFKKFFVIYNKKTKKFLSYHNFHDDYSWADDILSGRLVQFDLRSQALHLLKDDTGLGIGRERVNCVIGEVKLSAQIDWR